MAILVLTCPHCHSERMTFQVRGATPNPGYNAAPMVSVMAECQSCFHPVCAEMLCTQSGTVQGNVVHVIGPAMQRPTDLAASGFQIHNLWPAPRAPDVPDALPDEVRRSFLQGEKNFHSPDCEEAAATMYRRSLDLGLKLAYPEYKGDLHKRIEKLVADHILPKAIGDWAHQIRLVGNDGAHDVEGVNRSDLIACRNFVDAVLRYSFSFPKMVADRRADPAATQR